MRLLQFATDYINDILGLSDVEILSDGYSYLLMQHVDYEASSCLIITGIDTIRTKKQMLKWLKENLHFRTDVCFMRGYSLKNFNKEMDKIK